MSIGGGSSTVVLRALAPLRNALKHLPGVSKYLLAALLLLNIRSFPLAWHLRVFRPVILIRLQYYLLRLTILFKSRQAQREAVQRWIDVGAPIGMNPFEATSTYKTWASWDDSDYNGHLSNSSYAKQNDSARFGFALSHFLSFFREKGWMALGATHYHFLREIPMLHRYEIRSRIVGWDHKWIFIVNRFVSHSKPKNKGRKPIGGVGGSGSRSGKEESDNTPGRSFLSADASLRMPASGLETPATPANPTTTAPYSDSVKITEDDIQGATEAIKVIAAAQSQVVEEADGATLHCVSVGQLCFKHGRITVPPSLVLAASGFSMPPPSSNSSEASTSTYSLENPPPHMPHIRSFLNPLNERETRKLMRGGWKDVPESERWWEQALGGVIEEKRRTAMEGLGVGLDGPMGALRRGMDGARNV